MKSEKLLNAVGNISDELIADAAITARKKTQHPPWVKWSAVAACLCLILGCFFASKPLNSGIIYEYGDEAASYAKTPLPGEYFCYTDVYDAREHYQGQNVRFLLAIELFGNTEISDAEAAAEYARLEQAGYRLHESEYWTYAENGEKEYHAVVVGLFTEKELTGFKINPQYGYVFRFVTNGDGSHIQKFW